MRMTKLKEEILQNWFEIVGETSELLLRLIVWLSRQETSGNDNTCWGGGGIWTHRLRCCMVSGHFYEEAGIQICFLKTSPLPLTCFPWLSWVFSNWNDGTISLRSIYLKEVGSLEIIWPFAFSTPSRYFQLSMHLSRTLLTSNNDRAGVIPSTVQAPLRDEEHSIYVARAIGNNWRGGILVGLWFLVLRHDIPSSVTPLVVVHLKLAHYWR